jgi:hypothetical protein
MATIYKRKKYLYDESHEIPERTARRQRRLAEQEELSKHSQNPSDPATQLRNGDDFPIDNHFGFPDFMERYSIDDSQAMDQRMITTNEV